MRPSAALRDILKDDPSDYEALGLLLMDVFHANGQDEMAENFLAQRLAAPEALRDRTLLQLARVFYNVTNNHAQFLKVSEEYYLLNPPSPQRDMDLARVYLATDRAPKAVDLLTQTLKSPAALDDPAAIADLLGRALIRADQTAKVDPLMRDLIKRYPPKADDLSVIWALLYNRAGQTQRCEELLEQILKNSPGNAEAANALGYTLADQNRDLPRAKSLIASALKADPQSVATIDSMGWVLYKLGDYQGALDQFSKIGDRPGSGDPIILNHLGDISYRLGRVAEAVQFWTASQSALAAEDADPGDPEIKDLIAHLKLKFDAVAKNIPAPVADSPGAAKSPPATAPAP